MIDVQEKQLETAENHEGAEFAQFGYNSRDVMVTADW